MNNRYIKTKTVAPVPPMEIDFSIEEETIHRYDIATRTWTRERECRAVSVNSLENNKLIGFPSDNDESI